jgi:radical SAM protein with 4Fe4S-binding SPASM domain
MRACAARARRVRLGVSPNCSSLGNVVNVLWWTQAVAAAAWIAAEAWSSRRSRSEPGGGGSRRGEGPSGEQAIVQSGADPGAGARPVEAHVQVTRACGLGCAGCHVEPTADGEHVPVDVLAERFRALSAEGVFHVALGGGEVLRHPQLREIVDAARGAELSVGATTSGVGDLDRLPPMNAVNVSLDGLGASFRRSRGYDGAARALAVVRALVARRQRVGVNVLLDRHNFDELADIVAAAVDAGARDVQLLRLKPAGRARADYLQRRLTEAQGESLYAVVESLVARWPEVSFRVDCAMVPFLAAAGADLQLMDRWGILGCHGGSEIASIDTTGARHPCSFWTGPVTPQWSRGVEVAPCADCAYRAVCRGGCHVVADAVAGDAFLPDPECPRVIRATMPRQPRGCTATSR